MDGKAARGATDAQEQSNEEQSGKQWHLRTENADILLLLTQLKH